ncbi:MAG: hypothetical protein GF308_17995 [Candidatus Heimdallarchaeota archaeon]|nr:hypothetical protein [Candidatus Heimdallarchaeota archaeon]
MLLFRRKSKKKSIPKKKILKALNDKEYVDLGEPFGEEARRYLAYRIKKMLEKGELKGTLILPEAIFLSLTSSEVKDIVSLIEAKGICDLEEIAENNGWKSSTVKIIAKSRINLFPRSDGQIITQKTTRNTIYQKVRLGDKVSLEELSEELQLSTSIVKDILLSLMNEEKIQGVFIESSEIFVPNDLLEETIKEQIETYEEEKIKEISFQEIAEKYNISDQEVYNILRKLQRSGDLDIQLDLGRKICILKENVEREVFTERIPKEEKKLEIEDLTEKE